MKYIPEFARLSTEEIIVSGKIGVIMAYFNEYWRS